MNYNVRLTESILHRILREEIGLITNLEPLAEEILNKIKEEIENQKGKSIVRFFLPLPEKFFTYNGKSMKLEVVIQYERNSTSIANIQYSYKHNPILTMNIPYYDEQYHLDAGDDKYFGVIMHELTHLINSNKSMSATYGSNDFSDKSYNKKGFTSSKKKLVEDILYYFNPTEINAYLNSIYYEFKDKPEDIKNILLMKNGIDNLVTFAGEMTLAKMEKMANSILKEKYDPEYEYDDIASRKSAVIMIYNFSQRMSEKEFNRQNYFKNSTIKMETIGNVFNLPSIDTAYGIEEVNFNKVKNYLYKQMMFRIERFRNKIKKVIAKIYIDNGYQKLEIDDLFN